ncbi:MAG: phosphoribosyl-AMP cyclohydrolase [Candidatus Omnitrophica bacterium]|nr:phosphoribosyl-AMP cyclohydrolase [Candidatus Omnitrophota bacterium]
MGYGTLLRKIKFNQRGLVPAIIQDAKTNQVLMVAYMNRRALAKTLETGKTYFWSRSRKKLWLKGATSGHIQSVRSIFLDCDADTLLIKVRQKGSACHTGYYSCFYRKINRKSAKLKVVGKKKFDPNKVYPE